MSVIILGLRLVKVTYNSTSAGLPWPMILSKLSGVSSRTFDALAAANNDANNEKENNMVARREGGNHKWLLKRF